MESFKIIAKNKLNSLPKTSGIYCFKKSREFLYIGKASNIRERVKTHFQQPNYRDNLFIGQVKKIGYIKTGSEIEALLLEAKLIKKHWPKYNVLWRDDKNYFYVGIAKTPLPYIFLTHQTDKKAKYIGPFVDGKSLKKTLVRLRKIFPYYTAKKHPKSFCPWCHLKLCPGPSPDRENYKKNIRRLVAVLEGKSKKTMVNLKKEMKQTSKNQDYERAGFLRDQIAFFEKVLANAKILMLQEPAGKKWQKTRSILQKILGKKQYIQRVEAYDVSNIQGKEASGSMVVFIEGRPAKNYYRKFKIKPLSGLSDELKPNDVGMIKQVLSRRFNHKEWKMPELILIDGGKAQLNAAIEIKMKQQKTKNIPVVALAKKENELFIEKKKKPILLKNLPREVFNLILHLRDEAHRFAVSYHKKMRENSLLEN